MNKKVVLIYALLLSTIVIFTTPTKAALIVDITEGLNGGTNFTLTGSGIVSAIANPPNASLINLVTYSDTFIQDGTGTIADVSLSDPLTIGSASTSRAFVTDLDGHNDGLGLIHSRLGFGVFSGTIQVGDDLSSLNGTYYSDVFVFSDIFNIGSYSAVLGFQSTPISVTDIGDITINVLASQVPEPSMLALMGFGLAGLKYSRRRRKTLV